MRGCRGASDRPVAAAVEIRKLALVSSVDRAERTSTGSVRMGENLWQPVVRFYPLLGHSAPADRLSSRGDSLRAIPGAVTPTSSGTGRGGPDAAASRLRSSGVQELRHESGNRRAPNRSCRTAGPGSHLPQAAVVLPLGLIATKSASSVLIRPAAEPSTLLPFRPRWSGFHPRKGPSLVGKLGESPALSGARQKLR